MPSNLALVMKSYFIKNWIYSFLVKAPVQFKENKHSKSFQMWSDHEENRWVDLVSVYTYILIHDFVVKRHL